MQAAIKIGPRFFRNELREYGDWHWAYIREALQNCLDAPRTSTVHIEINKVGDNTHLMFQNDGESMSKEILIDKLLALGETGKEFQGTVGGFGKAKLLLYFAQDSYQIRTGTMGVTGSGGNYDLIETLEEFGGTRSEVVIPGDEIAELVSAVRRFASYTQWHGEIYLNGEKLDCDLRKGSPRRELSFGKVYTNKTYSNRLIVRVSGIPMFYDTVELDRCVIVELTGRSIDTLTSNRDSLIYKHRSELAEFLRELATDKKAALKNKQARYQRYGGAKLRHVVQKKKTTARDLLGIVAEVKEPVLTVASGAAFVEAPKVERTDERVVYAPGAVGVLPTVMATSEQISTDEVTHTYERIVSQISEEFIIRNETDLKVPDYYQPNSDVFCTYARKLARIWGRLILELHKKFALEAEFAIGFCFDHDAEDGEEALAMYENGSYGRVYYISPAEVVGQAASKSKSFKKRYKLTDRSKLLVAAIHEFTHGLGYGKHDAAFASKFAALTWEVMDDRKRFNWCFA